MGALERLHVLGREHLRQRVAVVVPHAAHLRHRELAILGARGDLIGKHLGDGRAPRPRRLGVAAHHALDLAHRLVTAVLAAGQEPLRGVAQIGVRIDEARHRLALVEHVEGAATLPVGVEILAELWHLLRDRGVERVADLDQFLLRVPARRVVRAAFDQVVDGLPRLVEAGDRRVEILGPGGVEHLPRVAQRVDDRRPLRGGEHGVDRVGHGLRVDRRAGRLGLAENRQGRRVALGGDLLWPGLGRGEAGLQVRVRVDEAANGIRGALLERLVALEELPAQRRVVGARLLPQPALEPDEANVVGSEPRGRDGLAVQPRRRGPLADAGGRRRGVGGLRLHDPRRRVGHALAGREHLPLGVGNVGVGGEARERARHVAGLVRRRAREAAAHAAGERREELRPLVVGEILLAERQARAGARPGRHVARDRARHVRPRVGLQEGVPERRRRALPLGGGHARRCRPGEPGRAEARGRAETVDVVGEPLRPGEVLRVEHVGACGFGAAAEQIGDPIAAAHGARDSR